VNRGTLTTRSAVQETKTYTIRNVDAKAKTLLIEHAERPGYKLLNEKPTETTSNAYRFEVKLAPNATEKFPVSEERVYDNSFAVSSLSPSNLLVYVQNKAIPDNARRQLQKILDQKISMNMIGDMNRYTQFQVAQSMPVAAANEGGGAGLGVGLGAGLAMGQTMMNAMKPGGPAGPSAPETQGAPVAPVGETKFCTNCGKGVPRPAKFCPECGTAQ